MLPADLSTVMTPSATFQRAVEWSLTDAHWSRLRPSNSTIASVGGAQSVAPGETTVGTGSHCSVAFGSTLLSLAVAGEFCALTQIALATPNAAEKVTAVLLTNRLCMESSRIVLVAASYLTGASSIKQGLPF